MSHTCSVALCTYNGEKYIQEQLESIINQSVPVDEIVICDDRSTDDTVKLVHEILRRHSIPFTILVNDCQLGPLKNFEKSISQ